MRGEGHHLRVRVRLISPERLPIEAAVCCRAAVAELATHLTDSQVASTGRG